MRLSQLTRRMRRGDRLCVRFAGDAEGRTIYTGQVRGIRREDTLNGAFVLEVRADEGVVTVTVTDPPREGNGNAETKN